MAVRPLGGDEAHRHQVMHRVGSPGL
jgi:hypothetical protein